METTSPANIDISSETQQILSDSVTNNNEQASFSSSDHRAALGIQERNFLLMTSLFNAAVEGDVDKFKEHRTILHQVLTPIENTILHIHITARPKRAKPNIFGKIGLKKKSEEGIHRNNFVTDILEMCPALLGKANAKGETLLHMAARHGHAEIVKVLIAECQKPHQNDPEKGIKATRLMLGMTNEAKSTALHEAVRYNQVEVVKILTEVDADLAYEANRAGETPLYLATERGYLDVMREIVSNCKSPADHGPMGRTALHAAVLRKDEEMTKILLDHKGSLASEPDEQGWLPLHFAAHFGCHQILKELLNTDKSAAYKADNKGKTALHLASRRGQVYVMHELIQSCPGCWELVDNKGRNVLHIALKSKNKSAVQLLLENPSLGNLINEKNEEGNTPLLQHAASNSFMKSFVCHPKVDKQVFDHKNCDVEDIIRLSYLMSYKQISFRRCFRRIKGRYGFRHIVPGGNEKQEEGNLVNNNNNDGKEQKKSEDKVLEEYVKEGKNAHLVVAALIATVTFAAGINMPGGYINEKNPDQGTAVLARSRTFQAFVIFNTIAMIFSSCAVFIHLFVSLMTDKREEFLVWKLSLQLITNAMVAMVLAFLLGMYAVIYSARELAISACAIGGLFLLVYACFDPLQDLQRQMIKIVRITVRKLRSEFSLILLRR